MVVTNGGAVKAEGNPLLSTGLDEGVGFACTEFL